MNHPGRSSHLTLVADYCRAIVSGIGELMERKIAGLQQVVRRGGRPGHLILPAMIGAGVEMATGASRSSIATRLHVPEQGFAQGDERGVVLNVGAEPGWLWKHGGPQRSESAGSATGSGLSPGRGMAEERRG